MSLIEKSCRWSIVVAWIEWEMGLADHTYLQQIRELIEALGL